MEIINGLRNPTLDKFLPPRVSPRTKPSAHKPLRQAVSPSPVSVGTHLWPRPPETRILGDALVAILERKQRI